MQVEYETESGTVMFRMIPNDGNPFNTGISAKNPIPEGFEFIGLSKEITEEQAKAMVDEIDELGYKFYPDKLAVATKSLVSFKSLMQHLKVYDVNPIPEPEAQFNEYGDGGYCESWVKYHQEAQQRTGKWAVLFKQK